MLTITRDQIAGTLILRCRGRIVHGEESALLCAALHSQGDLMLDLEGVTAIDAAGIGALLSLQAAGIYLKLVNPSHPVRAVLQLTGMASVFEICDELRITEKPAASPNGLPGQPGSFEHGLKTGFRAKAIGAQIGFEYPADVQGLVAIGPFNER